MHIGHPDIAVRIFIHPAAVIGQFRFIFIKFGRQVAAIHVLVLKGIPAPVPVGKALVGTGIVVIDILKSAVFRQQTLSSGDGHRSFLTGSFHLAFQHIQLGRQAALHINPEKTVIQHIK